MTTAKSSSKQNPTLVEIALAIALHAHRDQKDKAGAPYILHPLRIMLRMDTELEMTAAVLHDVVEDTQISIDRLREQGIPEAALLAIEHLSRRDGEQYDDFIARVMKNTIARKVKRADLEDNMDIRRIAHPTQKDFERLGKYQRAWLSLAGQSATDNTGSRIVA